MAPCSRKGFTITFRQELEQALPPGLVLPPELGELLEWLEEQQRVLTDEETGVRYASPYPRESGQSEVMFEVSDPDQTRLWLGQDDPRVHHRLAPIIRSGGEGSAIALWRDMDDTQAIVHLGSGSGSTMVGVMMRDPVDLIRLLAIGYDELCWPEHFDLTPAEVFAEELDEEFIAPVDLQDWVTGTFGKPIPPRASALVGPMGSMDGDPGADPFLIWLEDLER